MTSFIDAIVSNITLHQVSSCCDTGDFVQINVTDTQFEEFLEPENPTLLLYIYNKIHIKNLTRLLYFKYKSH